MEGCTNGTTNFCWTRAHIFYPEEPWLNIFLCMNNTTNVHESEQQQELVFCSHSPQAVLHYPWRAFISCISTLTPSSLWTTICISLLLKKRDSRRQKKTPGTRTCWWVRALGVQILNHSRDWGRALISEYGQLAQLCPLGGSATKPLLHNQ